MFRGQFTPSKYARRDDFVAFEMADTTATMLASDDATATVMAARSVADNGIDVDDPAAAARSDDAASIMLERGKGNKNGTKDIGIQA